MSLSKLVSYFGIASSKRPDFPRGVQIVTKDSGWKGFVDKYIVPQRELGLTRFLLWMPFGQEWDPVNDGVRNQVIHGHKYPTRVRFDQRQCAEAMGMDWLIKDFASAIRPLTMDGCQVIAYTGSLPGAPEYERRRWDRATWVGECLEPFMEANCDLAFDSACLAPADHYVTEIVDDLLQDAGAKVYCESMPQQKAPHWAEGDVCSVEGQYQAAYNPANRHILCDPAEIKGELVRWLTDKAPPKGENWVSYYKARVPEVLADGHTACIFAKNYIDQGGKLEDLVTA